MHVDLQPGAEHTLLAVGAAGAESVGSGIGSGIDCRPKMGSRSSELGNVGSGEGEAWDRWESSQCQKLHHTLVSSLRAKHCMDISL